MTTVSREYELAKCPRHAGPSSNARRGTSGSVRVQSCACVMPRARAKGRRSIRLRPIGAILENGASFTVDRSRRLARSARRQDHWNASTSSAPLEMRRVGRRGKGAAARALRMARSDRPGCVRCAEQDLPGSGGSKVVVQRHRLDRTVPDLEPFMGIDRPGSPLRIDVERIVKRHDGRIDYRCAVADKRERPVDPVRYRQKRTAADRLPRAAGRQRVHLAMTGREQIPATLPAMNLGGPMRHRSPKSLQAART